MINAAMQERMQAACQAAGSTPLALLCAPHRSAHRQHQCCRRITVSRSRQRAAWRCAVFDKFKDALRAAGDWQQQQRQQAERAGTAWEDDWEEAAEEGDPDMRQIDLESTGGLGGTTEDVFGPLAVLLVGYMQHEVEEFRSFMIHDLEADMVKIVPCTRKLFDSTIQEAMESENPAYEQPALGTRRVLMMSGMYGSEVVELVSAYREKGLPSAVFAAAVPNNWSRTVRDISESVWKDHSAMVAAQQQRRQLEGQLGEGEE